MLTNGTLARLWEPGLVVLPDGRGAVDMETSVAVKALLGVAGVAGVATVAAFILNIMNERRLRGLLNWVRTARPAAWQLLPRSVHLLPGTAAMVHLRRHLAGDIDFAIRDAAARRGRPAMLGALLTGVAAIGVVIAGVVLGVWST